MFILLNTAQWPCLQGCTWKTSAQKRGPKIQPGLLVFPKLFQVISVLKIFFSPKLNALCLLFIDTQRVALEECVSLISIELFQTQVSSCSNLKREREGGGGKERAGMSREETWRIRCDSPPTCGTHTHMRQAARHPRSIRRARLCPPPAHHARSPPQRFAAWRDCLIDSCPSVATSTEPAEELLLST